MPASTRFLRTFSLSEDKQEWGKRGEDVYLRPWPERGGVYRAGSPACRRMLEAIVKTFLNQTLDMDRAGLSPSE